MLEQGSVFAGYVVVSHIGSDGHDAAYLVENPSEGRREVLRTFHSTRPDFGTAAQVLSGLRHPGVAEVFAYGSGPSPTAPTEQLSWMTSEYVDGSGLDTRQSLSADEVSVIVGRIGDALEYVHRSGVVHGAVTPASIVVTRTPDGLLDRVVLQNFVVAPVAASAALDSPTSITFTPPEVLRGQPVLPSSDQYGLAATAYLLLTGNPPFAAPTAVDLVAAIMTQQPAHIGVSPTQSAPVDAVIRQALNKDPDARFPRCADFAIAFARQLIGSPAPAVAPAPPVAWGAPAPQPQSQVQPQPVQPSVDAAAVTVQSSAPDSAARRRTLILLAVAAVVLLAVVGTIIAVSGSSSDDSSGTQAAETSEPGPTQIPNPAGVAPGSWQQVSSKFDVACAITSGVLYCWGDNSAGLLGNGTTVNSSVPVRVLGLDNVTNVAVGRSAVCAISGGKPYCWGKGGSLGGAAGQTDTYTPVLVAGIVDATAIAAYEQHVCAVAGNDVYCWGRDADSDLLGQDIYQQGNGADGLPVKTTLDRPIAVSAGGRVTCAVAQGTAYCWGSVSRADRGVGDTGPDSGLQPVVGISGVTAISSNIMNSCAVATGRVYCWGSAVAGDQDSARPLWIKGIDGATMVSTGYNHRCAIAGGAAYCWGDQSGGKAGNGKSNGYLAIPTRVPGLGRVTDIAVDGMYSLAISDGNLYSWGSLN